MSIKEVFNGDKVISLLKFYNYFKLKKFEFITKFSKWKCIKI